MKEHDIVTELRMLGVNDSYLVLPATGLSEEQLYEYWGALYKADTLKYRWSDMADPTPSEVVSIVQTTTHCYFLVDITTGFIVADFSLGPFTGKSAQIHFSMLPYQNTRLNIFLAEEVTNMVLHQWKDVMNLEESFVDSLFGLTPVNNRPACIFIRKAGFKPIGTLVSGARYLNEVTDGLLTTKTRIN